MINISYLLSSLYGGVTPLFAATSLCVKTSSGGAPLFFGTIMLISLAVAVLVVASMWKLYIKAGKKGWESIVPIYNIIVLLDIVKKPGWWIILYFIPVVNFVTSIVVTHALSKSFGKDGGFTLGLIILPFIFYPILGFGNATYIQAQTPQSPPVVTE